MLLKKKSKAARVRGILALVEGGPRKARELQPGMRLGFPTSCEPGSPRRRAMRALARLALPKAGKINADLLLAAQFLLAYNDRPAAALLRAALEDMDGGG